MKLSFTTRGWRGRSWQEFCTAAAEAEFNGIELHDVHNPIFTEPGSILDPAMSNSAKRRLYEMGLEISCIDSVSDIADREAQEGCRTEIIECIAAAAALSIPYVRVQATSANKDSDDTIRACISSVLPEAEKKGVTLLIETLGIYSDTARLADMLNSFACDNLGALWDMHYTCRYAGESADTTVKNLGAYIKHVHLKDSVSDENGIDYRLIAEGTLPIKEMIDALLSINYDGFISLEWDEKWMPELDDMDMVFLHFVNTIQNFEIAVRNKKRHYRSADGKGRYVWKKYDLVDMTFSRVLDTMVEEFPDQYAFKYTTLDYTRTYSEFRDDVDNFARGLVSLGVKPGSKVAIWATNVPAWFITFWATVKIGAILVTVNTAYKVHEAEYLLKQSDTHTLVMIEDCLDSNYADIMNELCPELKDNTPGSPLHAKRLPFLRNVVTVGFKMPGCVAFDDVFRRAGLVPLEEIRRMADKVKPDDVCNMQYTSGTTGFPKGVMLTHYNIVNDGKCIGDRMDLSTADRMMIQVPMFHCFGMVLSMTSIMTHGGTLMPLPYFSAKASLACINQEHITCFNGVPTMFIAMFNHENYRKTDFSYIRTGIMAGSGCPPELMKRAAQPDEMNMSGIVSVYGQTESAPGSTMSAWDDPIELRTETVGYAFPHIECRVVDPETGLDVPDGENGEFLSRGYNQMKGYYKMPVATAQTIDSDGWLHSGDLACRNPDGTFRITGRLKDMIIRGGENIYPKEIEEFLYTNPKVKDVQVIGVPDKQYGEEICACIVLQKGETATVEEMRKFVMGSMARHKVPKYIDFVDSFPMNAAGKILKYKMREAAAEKFCKEQ